MSGNCVGHLRTGAVPDFDVVPVETVPSEQLPSVASLGQRTPAADPSPYHEGQAQVQRELACPGVTRESVGRPLPSLLLHSLAKGMPDSPSTTSQSW